MRVFFLFLAILFGCGFTEAVDIQKLKTHLEASLRGAEPSQTTSRTSYIEALQKHLAVRRIQPNNAISHELLNMLEINPVDLSGTWTTSDKTAEVIQTGDSLLIRLNDGRPDATGTWIDSTTILVTFWDDSSLTATVSENGKKLSWSNGNVWTLQSAETTAPPQHYYGGGSEATQAPQAAGYCDGGPRQADGVRFIRLTWYGDNYFADTTACDGALGVPFKNKRDLKVSVGRAYQLWYWAAYCTGKTPREDSPTARHSAWADWNQNGIFEDDEALWTGVLGDADGAQVFKIPLTAKLGSTRLRLQFVQGEGNTKPHACDSFERGDARDFPLTVSPGYCSTGGPTTNEDAELLSVQLQGEANTVLFDDEGCPGQIGVTDHTSTNSPVILYHGTTYRLNYNVGTCGDIYDTEHTAWADWNNNNIFETSEQLFPISTLKGLNSRQFTVPVDASVGTTRLRLQLKESGDDITTLSQTPCDDFEYGDTKDYSIFIHRTALATYDQAGYCSTGGPLLLVGAEFLSVSLNGEDGSSIQDNNGCPGVVGVKDRTNLNVKLRAGQTYSINYFHGSCDTIFEALHTAWIDWNQDRQFQATEQLYPSSEIARANTHQFQVPLNAIHGPTRLRLKLEELLFLGKDFIQNPCEDSFYGDTRDYTITII